MLSASSSSTVREAKSPDHTPLQSSSHILPPTAAALEVKDGKRSQTPPVDEEFRRRLQAMSTKVIVRNKNYHVFDAIPTPDNYPLPNCAYILRDLQIVHLSGLAQHVLELQQKGLALALLPSSVEVVGHLQGGGVPIGRYPKDVPRWAVITSFMIKTPKNLIQERDWFYVGEAVRQSVMFGDGTAASEGSSNRSGNLQSVGEKRRRDEGGESDGPSSNPPH